VKALVGWLDRFWKNFRAFGEKDWLSKNPEATDKQASYTLEIEPVNPSVASSSLSGERLLPSFFQALKGIRWRLWVPRQGHFGPNTRSASAVSYCVQTTGPRAVPLAKPLCGQRARDKHLYSVCRSLGQCLQPQHYRPRLGGRPCQRK
jgi:hypothetical protein